jgi:hypothetical protein
MTIRFRGEGWVLWLLFLLLVINFSSCSSYSFKKVTIGDISLKIPAYLEEAKRSCTNCISQFESDSASENPALWLVLYKNQKKSEPYKDYSLNDYYKLVADDLLSNNLESGSLQTPENKKINGLDALIFEVSGRSAVDKNNGTYHFKSAVIEGRNYFYEITGWTNDTTAVNYQQTMKEIFDSFQVTGE